jgi:hypothetical protein
LSQKSQKVEDAISRAPDVASADRAPDPTYSSTGSQGGRRDIYEECAAICEFDGGAVREVDGIPSEPALLAPGIWFNRFGPPGEPPFDQPCPSRRGLMERRGAVFLHFCVTCGAWGAFGYGAFGHRPGRWYCREHYRRPAP